MQGDEARELLGFPPNSRPTPSQVKAAYKKKVWESHPDLFPINEKVHAESRFKLISEAYTFLLSGGLNKGAAECYCHMVKAMNPLRLTGYIDPGWVHGVAQDEKKKKVKCNYCGKVVSGGIFRLKQHLARISGEVTPCDNAPEEVCLNMKENLEGCCYCRKRTRPETEQALISYPNAYSSAEEIPSSQTVKGKKMIDDNSLNINSASLRSLGFVDPGWKHCIAQDEKKKRVKCIYCERVITGGINRFKQHLARIPGEVAYCKKVPKDVYLKIKENMKWHRSGRRNRKPETDESSVYLLSNNEAENEEHDGGSFQCISIDDRVSDRDIRNSIKWGSGGSGGPGFEPLLTKSRLDSVFLKSLQIQASSDLERGKAKMGSQGDAQKEVTDAICKFFYYAGIPSSVVNSPYFHKMLEMVGEYGQILHGPLSRLISNRFLQDEIITSKAYLAELREIWMTTGCSIMADCWNDLHGRTRINFLASCPRGLYFISSFDASDIITDAGNLFKLLDNVVEEIGEENIVQVITKNTTSFRTAGKMLEEKRRHLFWTPCALHSIDDMLEDYMCINGIRETIDEAKRITRLIYNSSWLLNLLKKEFIKQELLKPAITKSGSTFLTIQSLLEQRTHIKRMFQSNKWIHSQISKSDKGKEVERIVLNPTFWKKMQYVRKSLEPVAHFLRKMDGDDSNSMSFMYNDMFQSKLAIKATHGDDAGKFRPFWSVIDNHLNLLFQHPLYVAAYFLNPSYRYRSDFIMNPEVVRGLNECIVRLETDSRRRISASLQIPDFVSAKVDFGTDWAIGTRLELEPAVWWQQHGISCSELQRIAVRILSQTCSSIGCEHNWSMYDQLHRERHNCVSRKKWNEHTYVHYNLRLRERLLGAKQQYFSSNSFMMESILGDWVAEVEKPAVQEDEEIVCRENDMEKFYGDEVGENNPEEKKLANILPLVVAEPVENNPATGVTTADDDSLDFLQDNMTE